METISKTDCEKIGYFKKTHGVNGDLVLEFEPQFESSVEESNCFFVELEGLLVPFFVSEDGFRFKTDSSAIVSFNWVDTEKYAKRMIGAPVYLFKNEIVEDDVESDLGIEGFTLFDKQSGEVGKIKFIDDYSGNIVLTVDYKGNDLLVPYNEELLIAIDEKNKTITLELPEGLIE